MHIRVTDYLKWLILIALALSPSIAFAATSTGFDVEAASRLYIKSLKGANLAKSNAYFEGGYWLILWGMVFAVLVDWIILRGGLASRMRDFAERKTRRAGLITWITAVGYTILGSFLTLPWSIYTGYFREKQYDLISQSFSGWFGEFALDIGLSLIIMPLLIVAIYAVIRRAPKSWWIWGTGITGLFLLIGAVITPVFLAPLFNTYSELPEGPVRDRIVAMAKTNDVPAEHIYLFDASKQSKRISANVSGLGPTIRISLNDNLLNRTTEAEVAAVMGHELGHYVLGHVWRIVLVMLALVGACLFLISIVAPRLITRYGDRWGVRDLADPASLPLLGIMLSVFFFLATPITNTLIRVNESEADAFGLNAAREPDGFAKVAMRLSEYRKIEPAPIEEMLFFDHPSGATRVRMSMAWKEKYIKNPKLVDPGPIEKDAE